MELQAELARRASIPVDSDPVQTFDSSMSRDEVRARFFTMVERARESVYA